jgi:hypothetical protein
MICLLLKNMRKFIFCNVFSSCLYFTNDEFKIIIQPENERFAPLLPDPTQSCEFSLTRNINELARIYNPTGVEKKSKIIENQQDILDLFYYPNLVFIKRDDNDKEYGLYEITMNFTRDEVKVTGISFNIIKYLGSMICEKSIANNEYEYSTIIPNDTFFFIPQYNNTEEEETGALWKCMLLTKAWAPEELYTNCNQKIKLNNIYKVQEKSIEFIHEPTNISPFFEKL